MSSRIFRLTWKACFFIVDSSCTGLSRSPGPGARLSVPWKGKSVAFLPPAVSGLRLYPL